MTFDLFTIALMIGAALIYTAVLPSRWRGWYLLALSVVAVYALQPRLDIRHMDFILPTATLMLSILGWYITRPVKDDSKPASTRDDWFAFAIVIVLIVGMSLFRYIDADYRLTPSRPPNPLWVLAALLIFQGCLLALRRVPVRAYGWLLLGFTVFIVLAFVALKTPTLATIISSWGRTMTGRDPSLASPLDLNWLGFSYVAFRLLHTLRDRQTGLLPALSLREYLTYIIFFPAFIAGPIDRAERFKDDLRNLHNFKRWDGARMTVGFSRIAIGIFKKFIIADSLAAGLALNPINAAQAESTLWLWVLLYGYALRLFFDFSGYSDIAIGIGILFGITLPENFNRPYLQSNLTTFWQSWHITLSNWARAYVFSPLSRILLRRKPRPNPTVIVLSTQVATMLTIGLWHGVTWNFFIWGLWHGIGLFVHKQWSDRTGKWYRSLKQNPLRFRLWTAFAWLLTFHYVVLGWVWFVLPTPPDSLATFARLFGWGGA